MITPGTSTMSRGKSAIVTGEYLFTSDDFRTIAAMAKEDSGIALPEAKATLVYSRLAKRLRALGIKTFKDYCSIVEEGDGEERQIMLAALTTNVTRFFREPHHFEHMKSKILPRLLDTARGGGRVRLWSSACSNGQEPYSMAMTILSLAPDAAKLDIKILATDIDPNMVADGRAGIYDESIVDAIPVEMRRRWFAQVAAPHGGSEKNFSANEELRELVAFRELNLIGNWPMRQRFDVIFCRNVAIYFDDDTQAKIWSRFASQLVPGGTLYIGHSERVAGEAASKFRTDGITTYQLREGATA